MPEFRELPNQQPVSAGEVIFGLFLTCCLVGSMYWIGTKIFSSLPQPTPSTPVIINNVIQPASIQPVIINNPVKERIVEKEVKVPVIVERERIVEVPVVHERPVIVERPVIIIRPSLPHCEAEEIAHKARVEAYKRLFAR